MCIPPTIRASILIYIFIDVSAIGHTLLYPGKSEKFCILRKSEYFSKMYDATFQKK